MFSRIITVLHFIAKCKGDKMAKYKKRPVFVDAIQWTGRNRYKVKHFLKKDFMGFQFTNNMTVKIKTLEGIMRASCGDWIIRGVKGELYPCKPDIFESTYEPVTEESDDEDS